MMKKGYDQRLCDLIEKQKQLQAQEKVLRKRHGEEQRKLRTKRLIELGGIVEHVLKRPAVDEDKIRFYAFLEQQERNGSFFSKAMSKGIDEKEENAEPHSSADATSPADSV